MLNARRVATALATALLAVSPGAAQEPPAGSSRATQAIRVFLDCVAAYCDEDFVRTEILFVNWVRDRRDADLHVLVTSQETGSGGREYALKFLGQGRLAGAEDEFRFVSPQTDTDDETRRAFVQRLKLGLVRYVAATPLAERLEISYSPGAAGPATVTPADDPWHFWVFRSRLGGFFDGERAQKFANINVALSANRTTEAWKTNLAFNLNYRSSRFQLSETDIFTNITRDYGMSALVVRSFGDHWAAGMKMRANGSTFLNQDFALRIAPGFEYNAFPYADSTRRQLTFQYTAGLNAFDYEEETIFNKLSETLQDQTLLASLDVRQPWGSTSTSLELSHYLHDLGRNRVVVFSDVEVRVFRGFNLSLGGSFERVRDQLFLPREGATPEEILVRRRQLETSYRYFLSFGFSYTFGSIYNNVVNPRFGGSSGGYRIVM